LSGLEASKKGTTLKQFWIWLEITRVILNLIIRKVSSSLYFWRGQVALYILKPILGLPRGLLYGLV
jgi:hypothetical protein